MLKLIGLKLIYLHCLIITIKTLKQTPFITEMEFLQHQVFFSKEGITVKDKGLQGEESERRVEVTALKVKLKYISPKFLKFLLITMKKLQCMNKY